jgi:O-antigen/teichoic acid export membrane protein
MSLLKQLAGETAIYGLSSIIGRVVSWVIMTPYLTRVFEKAEYGIVSVLYFYIAFLLVIFTYRMETAYFRFASKAGQSSDSKEEINWSRDTIFSTASLAILGTTVFLTSLLLFFAPQIAAALDYAGRADYVRIFTLIIAFDALSAIPFARLRMDSRPIRFATIKLAAIFFNIVLVFFFLEACPWLMERGVAWAGYIYNPEKRIAYVFWANLIASGATLLWLAPLYRNLLWRFAKDLWQRMVRYSLPLVLASLAGIVNSLIGTPLLQWFGPGTVEENLALGGVYAAAAKLAVLMNLFIQAFNYAAEPFFFRQAAASEKKKIYADVARAFALVGSLAFMGIMLYLDIIQYFLGDEYREGLGILPILLVANFFLGLYFNFSIGYKLTDQTRWGGYLALMGAVITLVLGIGLIPTLGYYAPAWASLACFFSMTLGGYWLTRRLWPVDYQLWRMAYYLILALGSWALALCLQPFLPVGIAYTIAANTLILVIALAVLYKTEAGWLKSVIS